MGRSGLDAQHTLLFGAIAGAASEAVVYPMEVIRRRMQLMSMAPVVPGTTPSLPLPAPLEAFEGEARDPLPALAVGSLHVCGAVLEHPVHILEQAVRKAIHLVEVKAKRRVIFSVSIVFNWYDLQLVIFNWYNFQLVHTH